MSTNKTVVSLEFLLVVCALISFSHQAAVDESADLKQSFKEINSYLSENVEAADAEANIEAARRLLEVDTTSEPMREAVELFVSLDKVKSNHKCNLESHEILANNIGATGRQVSEFSKEANKNRVEQVIYQSAVDLAKHCLHVYPDKLKEKYYSLDSDDGELVETLDRFFLKDIYAIHFGQNFMVDPYKNHPISHKSFFRQTDSIGSSQDANVAIKALRFFASGEEEADRNCLYSSSDDCEPAERNRVVERLFEKYLEQPCRRYDLFLRFRAEILPKLGSLPLLRSSG